jgi:hypothetical protein
MGIVAGMKRVILGVVAVGTLVAGCSAVTNSGPSYRDGEAFAQGEVQQGNPLVGDPKDECMTLVAQGSVPAIDDQTQWVAGCEAALANQHFFGGTGTGAG